MSDSKRRRQLMDQLQFLAQMSSTETALFHQAAAAKYGLGITDMKMISTLMQEEAMTAGQLGQRLGLTTGAVTTAIDRLEQRGCVKRTPDTKDRRKVIVSLDESNMAKFSKANVYDSIAAAYAKLLDQYSTEELEFLAQYHQATVKITKQEIAKLSRVNETE